MESNILCSVIVPVYNVEKYLRRCLDSLKNQEGNDFEVILVDDGSTDNSLAICNEYAATDTRFKVIHKENGGVSSARNVGIDQATGKYIAFVDSDDYVTKDYFETLRPLMSQDHELIVFNNYQELGGGKAQTYNRGLEERVYSIEELKNIQRMTPYYKEFFTMIGMVPWNKLYNRSIIRNNKLRFNIDMCFAEDAYFIFDFLTYVNRLYLVNKPLYFYNTVNTNSAIRALNAEKIKNQLYDTVRILKRRKQYASLINLNFDFNNNYIDSIMLLTTRLVKSNSNRKQIYAMVYESGASALLIDSKPIDFYHKIVKWMILHKQYKIARYIATLYNRINSFLKKYKDNKIIVEL